MESLTYLDHAATTPVRPEVLDAMRPYLGDPAFANPASAHRAGRAARAALVAARRALGDALGTDPARIFFVSGGTEADNLAILGSAEAARRRGEVPRVAVSAVEHRAVLEPAQLLASRGGETIVLPVEHNGQVDVSALETALHGPALSLVSVMWVNNEIGAIQPVERIAAMCAARGVAFHTDAVQAIGKVPVDLATVPEALVTISGHKLGAPIGVGALVVPHTELITPILHGGGQQQALRPGTENVPAAVALATAVKLAVAEQAAEELRLGTMRQHLERCIVAGIPDVRIHGIGGPRAPHVLSVQVWHADANTLLAQLDLAGIAASGGSACSTGATRRSHVIEAIAISEPQNGATLRFSFGHSTTSDDIERCAAVLPEAVARTRDIRGAFARG